MKKHIPVASKFAEPVENLLEDTEELLAATAHVAEEKVVAARKRLTAAVQRGKEAWRSAQATAVRGAKATDRAVREHPYHSIGLAFGVGILLGFLVRRRD